MVTITSYETRKNKNDEDLNVLELQREVEMIKSTHTGKFYAHARRATITSTLNKQSCKALIGAKFTGSIKRVEADPYIYKVPGTDDTITLNHTYQYVEKGVHEEEIIFQGEVK